LCQHVNNKELNLILIIFIITPHSLLHSSLASSQTHTGFTDQALLVRYSAENFRTIHHILNVIGLCSTIYRGGRRLNSFSISCNLFGIIPIAVIIIIIIISFMQGIYTYIPQTNSVPREYIVAAILLLLFIVPISPVPALVLLCFYFSTFRSTCTVPNIIIVIIIIIILTQTFKFRIKFSILLRDFY
jgi:hypothetical protein